MRLMLVGAAAVSWIGGTAIGQTIWDGPSIVFTKPDSADWNLPENQDRITDNVWITRADFQGLFNYALEGSYGPGSPADTEWAYGSAADWQNLTFTSWFDWHGGNPFSAIGQDAVVHLITDDIYIDITLLSWSCCGDGGFSYERSTMIPAPSGLAMLSLGALAPPRRRRRSR